VSTRRKVCVDIALSYEEGRERVHYRVLGSTEEDWSGWADSEEQAILQAKARKDDVMFRLVADATRTK
jgi:hypothetical protein